MTQPKEDVWCEKCGCQMVLRQGKYGEFFGCLGYPHCKATRKAEPVEFEAKFIVEPEDKDV